MATTLQHDECQRCGEEVIRGEAAIMDAKGVQGTVLLELEPTEVEVFSVAYNRYVRGHERHWKYCTARPTTGSASAEPPDEPPDEPDKVLNE